MGRSGSGKAVYVCTQEDGAAVNVKVNAKG